MGSESVNWSGFSEAEPELAQRIRGRFDAHLHHVVGTLDSSGAPRVSGTEGRIVDDDVWLGSMVNSVKVLDLRRDPRCSIHSAPLDAEMKDGDAKLSGLAVEVTDRSTIEYFLDAVGHPGEPSQAALFTLQITKAVLTWVAGEQLEVDYWSPAGGLERLRPS